MEKLDDLLEEVLEESPIVEDAHPPREDNDDFAGDDSLEWARDVYWCSRRLGERPTKAKAGTGLRYHLWDYARKNTKEFVGQIMPKAMTILDRANAKAKANSEVVEVEERKGIAELQRILRQAIRESQAA